MVDLVSFLKSAKDGDRVLNRRFRHHYRLETPLKRRVGLDIFAVFVKRCGSYAVYFAARQHRLKNIARVHCAVGLSRADDGVYLVDEKDYPALACLDLAEHGFKTFLKFAAELCARDKSAHIERENGAPFEIFGYVAAHYTLCQSLGYCGLAHARLTYKAVLGLTGEDADDVSYLLVTPYYRVELLRPSQLHKVLTVLFQCVVGGFGVVGGHLTVSAHRAQGFKKRGAVKPGPAKHRAHGVGGLVEQPELLLGESLKEFLHGAVTSGQNQNGIAEVPKLLFAFCHVVCHNDFVKTVL